MGQSQSQFITSQRRKLGIKKNKMRSFVLLVTLLALASANENEYENVETREICRPGTGSTGPICKKEVLKREVCRPGAGGRPHCKRIEDEEYINIETREYCRPGTGSTGPICKKEVLKREMCRPGAGTTGPRCKRVENEEEYEMVEAREMCRPGTGTTGPR